jgi:hypothetical protein
MYRMWEKVVADWWEKVVAYRQAQRSKLNSENGQEIKAAANLFSKALGRGLPIFNPFLLYRISLPEEALGCW